MPGSSTCGGGSGRGARLSCLLRAPMSRAFAQFPQPLAAPPRWNGARPRFERPRAPAQIATLGAEVHRSLLCVCSERGLTVPALGDLATCDGEPSVPANAGEEGCETESSDYGSSPVSLNARCERYRKPATLGKMTAASRRTRSAASSPTLLNLRRCTQLGNRGRNGETAPGLDGLIHRNPNTVVNAAVS